jgi:predicted outer membrane protein
MVLFRRIGMALLIAALAGCASQVTRPPAATATREPVRALTSFEIEISPAAKAAMADAKNSEVRPRGIPGRGPAHTGCRQTGVP